MIRVLLVLLTLCFTLTVSAGAKSHNDDHEYAGLLHCGDASLDPQGWLRVTCAYEIDAGAVGTIYVWFPRELANDERADWQVNGAAYPIVVNPIRANPREGKRHYLKYRVFNPAPVEQYVTMVWLIRGR